MDTTVLILQIITIVISVSTLIVNTLITRNESRKKHYLEITTSQRKKIYNDNRDNQAEMIALCMPECIDEKKLNNCQYKTELTGKYSKLIYQYKQIYEDENEIILSAHNLLFNAYAYYDDSTTKNSQALLDSLAKFYKLTSIYDASDWMFLKSQSVGKMYNSDDFDKIINKKKKEFTDVCTDNIFKRL